MRSPLNATPFEMVEAEDNIALLVDHQAWLMPFTGDIDPVHLRNNSIALTKVLEMHKISVVLTAAAKAPGYLLSTLGTT
jgi:hypothetical protein